MLNKNQIGAVNFKDGPCLVLAGPGSGKTTVITRRIQTLVSSGVNPENILVITFTKAAAKEMQDRFLRLDPGGTGVCFGTFHSIFFHILSKEYHYKAGDILSESTKRKILKDVLRKRDILLSSEESLESFFDVVGKIKSGMLSLTMQSEEEYLKYSVCGLSKNEFLSIFNDYQNSLEVNHFLDFDDMVGKTFELFQMKPEVLSIYQNIYKYVLVDEFQDISPLQYEVVKLLAAPQNNLFIVGDDDQAIYGFRGSDPGIMLGFENDYKNATIIRLDTNYRCNKSIVDASCKLIEKNKSRFNKAIHPFNMSSEQGVECFQFNNEIEEARAVAKRIKTLYANGTDYDEIAVLFRNHTVKELLEEVFTEERIPFFPQKQKTKAETEILKDIESYMKIARNTAKRSDYLRVINKPERGILRQALDGNITNLHTIKNYYLGDEYVCSEIDKWVILNKNLIKLPAPGALSLIKYGLGYENYLKINNPGGLSVMDNLIEKAKAYKNIDSFLVNISQEKEETKNKLSGKAVSLYTMHASKGLEFRTVFIVQLNEGIVPDKKSKNNLSIEEERRLFYVAVTRAKEKLFLSSTKMTKSKEMIPSRFLDELIN